MTDGKKNAGKGREKHLSSWLCSLVWVGMIPQAKVSLQLGWRWEYMSPSGLRGHVMRSNALVGVAQVAWLQSNSAVPELELLLENMLNTHPFLGYSMSHDLGNNLKGLEDTTELECDCQSQQVTQRLHSPCTGNVWQCHLPWGEWPLHRVLERPWLWPAPCP